MALFSSQRARWAGDDNCNLMLLLLFVCESFYDRFNVNMVQVEELYKERLYLSVRIAGTLTSAVNLRPYLKKAIEQVSRRRENAHFKAS